MQVLNNFEFLRTENRIYALYVKVKRLHSEIVKRNKLNDQQNRDRNENIGVAFGIGALVAVGVGIALSLRKK